MVSVEHVVLLHINDLAALEEVTTLRHDVRISVKRLNFVSRLRYVGTDLMMIVMVKLIKRIGLANKHLVQLRYIIPQIYLPYMDCVDLHMPHVVLVQ